ncbi:MAG TPA: acyltransferase [Thermoanaerobaculia bacterium]|nr:acyltransferase [Thermoanaerobaculia bacterium]
MTYRPQLDGIRALAILIVLFAHFAPPQWTKNPYASIGYLGVELFFVLSGFLITGILLGDREAVATGQYTRWRSMTRFYLRRAVRIFPTYYLVLAFALAAGLGITKSSFGWFAAYLTNFYIVRHGPPGSSTHLWSLAVEEQFYLIWPMLVLFLRGRLLPAALAAIGMGGLVFRHVAAFPYADYLLFACLDYLAAGAALALVFRRSPAKLPLVLRWSLVVAAIAAAAALFVSGKTNWINTAFAALSVWLVGRAATGFGGPFGRWLQSPPMVYVGRISYGLYLYHLFIPEGLGKAAAFYGVEFSLSPIERLLVAALAFAIAAASWHFVELPLQRWRRSMRPL